MKKIITGNIWDYISIDDMNGMVDDIVREKIRKTAKYPTDICYEFKSISKDGKFKVEAKFTLE